MKINTFHFEAATDFHIDEQGWCEGSTIIPSPNFGVRPLSMPITLLVVHNVSLPMGIFEGNCVIDLFLNQLDCSLHPSFESLHGLEVSSHFFIRRDGTLIQFVSTLDRAWHAGLSSFNDVPNCNDYSIGIELEGSDEIPFEHVQYQCLRQLCSSLIERFPITDIVGHSDIASGRKTDPGPFFKWENLQSK